MSTKITNAMLNEKMDALLNGLTEMKSDLKKIDERVSLLEGQKKPSTPKGKPATATQPKMTKRESIKAWAEKKYTPEERAAYGAQKQAERAKQRSAYEAANAFFKDQGKVDYKIWRAKYEELLSK